MNSKKRITIVACGLFIMLGFLVNGVSMLYENRYTASKIPDVRTAAVSANTETHEDPEEEMTGEKSYIIKIRDGVVVVFDADNINNPIFVTDIYASTLRHFDRELLSEGITVKGEYELQSIIEDFSN